MTILREKKCPARALIYTIFSLGAVFAQAQTKLCYSTETKSLQSGEFNGGQPSPLRAKFVRDDLALSASDLIYKLGDLETAQNAAELLAKHAEFSAEVPRRFHLAHYSAAQGSGLKYMILAPDEPEGPWIFAFAGTQTAIDWMSDLNLGRAQFSDIEGLLFMFTNCEYTDGRGQPWAAREWIVTGHSLGGGLAEMFAYSAQKRRLQMGLAPAHISLVTFNAFGALETVERSWEDAAPVTSTLSTANYFVTGDIVSRIGTHIGATYELTMPAASLMQAAKRHSLETVAEAARQNGGSQFDSPRSAVPPRAAALNTLKNYMGFFHFLPSNQAERVVTQLQQVNTLGQAVNILVARKLSAPYDHEAMRYIGNAAMMLLRAEEGKPQVGLRPQRVQDLRNILKRSAAALQR